MSFGNRSVAVHLARGAIGFGALALAIAGGGWVWPLALLPIALVALKGCPICWTMGLVETIVMKVHSRTDGVSGDKMSLPTA